MPKIIARLLNRPRELTVKASTLSTLDPSHPIQAAYDRALQIAQGGRFDNDGKRARFFMRHQYVLAALARWPALDLAECGCWHGHSTIMTSEAAKAAGFAGRFSVFDSFAGLSDFAGADLTIKKRTAEHQQKTKKHFVAPEQHLREITRGYGFVDIYPGWIPSEFPRVANRTFSFVHIDVDLHDPTRDALEFFYPRLTAGGAIFFDDYASTNFPGASAAIDGFLKTASPAMFLVFPLGGAVLVK